MQVSLPQQTVEKLRRLAIRKKTGVSELLNQVVEKYLTEEVASPLNARQDERLEQIAREQQAYETQHNELFRQYAGQYIAMRGGQMVDHDADRAALGKRVRARFGKETLLITPVLDQPCREFIVRSPHLVERTG